MRLLVLTACLLLPGCATLCHPWLMQPDAAISYGSGIYAPAVTARTDAPEIDSSSAVCAVTLLAGSLAAMRGRRHHHPHGVNYVYRK